MKILVALSMTSLFALFTTAATADENPIVVRDAWIREAPPNAKVLAAYMNLENTGADIDAITSIHSEAFEKAEIHRTVIKDGMAGMEPVAQLALPAHEIVKLEPSGTHMMLIDPKSALRAGQRLKLHLTFKTAAAITVEAEVRKSTPSDDQHHLHK